MPWRCLQGLSADVHVFLWIPASFYTGHTFSTDRQALLLNQWSCQLIVCNPPTSSSAEILSLPHLWALDSDSCRMPSQSGLRYQLYRYYRFCRFIYVRDRRGLILMPLFKLLKYSPFQFPYPSYSHARNPGNKELLIGSLLDVYLRFIWEEFSNSGSIENNWLGSCKVDLLKWFWCEDLIKHLIPCSILSLMLKVLTFYSSLTKLWAPWKQRPCSVLLWIYLMVFIEVTGSSSAEKAKDGEC